MSADPKIPWWEPDVNTPPCIFDVNMRCVDEVSPWVQLRKRARMALAAHIHPAAIDPNIVPHNTLHLTSPDALPQWVQNRIAVLNMADPGMWIDGVGKRWTSHLDSRAPDYEEQTIHRRYYTLPWNFNKE